MQILVKSWEKKLSVARQYQGASVAFAGATTALAFFFAYRAVILALIRQWLSNDIYTHGFLIPVISLYLVWVKRGELREINICPAYGVGTALLIFGLAILVAGDARRHIIAEELSLPITLAGIVAFIMGFEFLKVLGLPIAYSLFMIPVWSILTDPLVPYYQTISAVTGSFFMEITGITVHRNGLFIELPNVTLEVAKACSGISYMIAVIAIGIPLGYLFISSWKRRAALMSIGLAIATVFNGVRIGLIGIMSYHGISSVLHGPGHILQALSVSVSGFAGLFAGLWLLADRHDSPLEIRTERKMKEIGGGSDLNKCISFYSLVPVLISLTVVGLIPSITKPVHVPPKEEQALLQGLDKWQGRYAASAEFGLISPER